MPALPSVDIEVLLPKERNDHSPVCKLPARQSLQGLLSGSRLIVLDVDLAHAVGLSAAATGTRDLNVLNFAVFVALLLDVFFDF